MGGTQQIGTSLDDFPSAMTIDASENIFLVGTTIGSLARRNGDNDTFLIKLNKSGIKQWVKQEEPRNR